MRKKKVLVLAYACNWKVRIKPENACFVCLKEKEVTKEFYGCSSLSFVAAVIWKLGPTIYEIVVSAEKPSFYYENFTLDISATNQKRDLSDP